MSAYELILREVEDTDLPLFFEHQADPVAYTMADFKSRDRDAFMEHWAKIRADPDNRVQSVVVDGQVVGNVMCFRRDGLDEVGYWIGREFWGRGYASDALARFLPTLAIRPLYAGLVKTNEGSRRVLEKCGFTVVRDEAGDLLMRLD
jgi:RimJ/RimL family protein N-acetyltransferase